MTNILMHHGIKGQKWGVRRFQNADGSLTGAGKKRYGKFNIYAPTVIGRPSRSKNAYDEKRESRKSSAKKIAIGAAIVAGTALAAYSGYKVYTLSKDNRALNSIKLGASTVEKFGASPKNLKIKSEAVPSTHTKIATIETPRTEIQRINIPTAKIQRVETSYAPKLTLDSSKTSSGKDYLSQILKTQQTISEMAKRNQDMVKVYGDLDDFTYELLKKH